MTAGCRQKFFAPCDNVVNDGSEFPVYMSERQLGDAKLCRSGRSLHALHPSPQRSSWPSEDVCVKPCDDTTDQLSSYFVLGIGVDGDGE